MSSPDLGTYAHLLTDSAVREAVTNFAVAEQLKQFKFVREDRGVSRDALAEQTGIPVKTIAEIEEGHFMGDVRVPRKLAHALGCTLKVGFESFGSLPAALETMRTDPKSLIPVPFKYDPGIFTEWPGLQSFDSESNDRVLMVRKIKDWSESGNARDRKAQLVGWLNGFDVPQSGRSSPGLALATALGGSSREAETMFADRMERLLIDTSRWLQRNYCEGPEKRIAADWTTHPLSLKNTIESRAPVEVMHAANRALGELVELAGQKQLFGDRFRGPLQDTWRVLIKSELPDNQSMVGRSLGQALDGLDGILPKSVHREMWQGVKIDPKNLRL